MVTGPRWKGKTPKRITKVFQSDTDFAGVLGRTEPDGTEDQASVQALQAQYKIQPFHEFASMPAPPAAPAITFPSYDNITDSLSNELKETF